jgi:hypothetical protein
VDKGLNYRNNLSFSFLFPFPLVFLFSFIFSFYFSPLSPPHPPVSLIAILTSASPFTPAGGSLAPAPAPLSCLCRRLAPRTRPWAPPLHAPPAEGGRRVEGGARRVAADAKGKEAPPWPATTRSCRRRHLLHGYRPLPRGALPCRPPTTRSSTATYPVLLRSLANALPHSSRGPLRARVGVPGAELRWGRVQLPRDQIALVSAFSSRFHGEAVFLPCLVVLRQK